MSDWKDFLNEAADTIKDLLDGEPEPGEVMICFVNRYLEAADGIKYKIKYDGQEKSGTTTEANYCVTVQPKSFKPIETWVWSRSKKTWKKLDDTIAAEGQKKLVRKVMLTFKAKGKTEKQKVTSKAPPPPEKPRPAVAPAPSPTKDQGIEVKPKTSESGNPIHDIDRPVPNKITLSQMQKIWPAANSTKPEILARVQAVRAELNSDLVGYKLDTPLRRAHFMAQVREEAGPLFRFVEDLEYSAARLKTSKTEAKSKGTKAGPFMYFWKNHSEADKYGSKPGQPANQVEIANRAYANKLGNGGIASGDGWRFRGRGLKQLTARANYRDFTAGYKLVWPEVVDFEKNPDLLAEPKYAVRSAAWFWLHHKLYLIADKGGTREQVDAITAKINKHTDSYTNRWTHFKATTFGAFR